MTPAIHSHTAGAHDLLVVEGLRLDVPDLNAPLANGKRPWRPILQNVSFRLPRGGCLGVIGESGSGKSSLARALTLLMPPQRGLIQFEGQDMARDGVFVQGQALTQFRMRQQLVFQDPMSALNPRKRVGTSIAMPAVALNRLLGRKPMDLAAQLLDRVGLPTHFVHRYPHELSGGQRQRVNIARALALEPTVLIADEVTSGLDVSAQAHIVALLEGLRSEMGLAVIFISHDLSLVRSLCDDLLILRNGEIQEQGAADRIFEAAQSPYTQGLLDAIALPDPDLDWLQRPGLNSSAQ